MLSRIILVLALTHLACTVTGNFTAFSFSDTECSASQKAKLDVVFAFFERQHFITLVDMTIDHNLSSMRCTKGNVFYPVRVYKDCSKVHLGPEIVSNSLSYLPTSHGYSLKGNLKEILEKCVPKIGKHNPKTRIIMHLTGKPASPQAKLEILKFVYEKYEMLDVAILSQETPKDNQSAANGSLCLYNPFTTLNDKLKCTTFTAESINRDLQWINDVAESRIANLYKFPLKVDIFPFPMVSKPVYGVNNTILKFSYMDGAALDIIADTINFTPVFLKTSANSTTAYHNGTFIGSFAALELGGVDFVANPRMIENYPTSKGVFMQATSSSKYNFIIKRRERTRHMMITLMGLYDWPTKILTVLLFVAFPLIVWLAAKFEIKNKGSSLIQSFMYVISLQNNMTVVLPQKRSSRIITMTIVFYALIITSLMQGTLVEKLNSSETSGAIKTIEELLDQNYKLVITHAITRIMSKQKGDRLRDRLSVIAKTNQATTQVEGMKMLLEKENIAFLWTGMHCGNYLNRYFDPNSGENLLEVVPETAFEFYVATMSPKASPFIDRINDISLRIVESGLDIYHLNRASADNDNVWYQRLKLGQTPKAHSMSLKLTECREMFKLLMFLVALCVVTFILELLFFRLSK